MRDGLGALYFCGKLCRLVQEIQIHRRLDRYMSCKSIHNEGTVAVVVSEVCYGTRSLQMQQRPLGKLHHICS
jgi:hypothetical protein